MPHKSDGPLYLIGTEASGTSVHMAGSSIHDCLDPLDVGLPFAVGTSVGVGHLNTKGNALATKITLRHSLHLPSEMILCILRPIRALRYNIRLYLKKQVFFCNFFRKSKIG